MKKLIYAVMSFVPVLALAAVPAADQNLTGISTLISSIGRIVNQIIPLLFAVAIIFFFWGLLEFVRSAGNEEKAKEGKSHMIYGVIALAVMVSIYGLIAWLQGTFGIDANAGSNLNIPTVNIPSR